MTAIQHASNIGSIPGLRPVPGAQAAQHGNGTAYGTPTAGSMMQAIGRSLAQAGISGSFAPGTAQATMGSFVHTLLAALHREAAGGNTDMQGLIRRVSAAVDPRLQQSFQALAGGMGTNSASLGSFLQTLAANLQGASSIGSVVSTTA